MSSQTCEVSPRVLELLDVLRFRKAKTPAALVFKIDPKALLVVEAVEGEGVLEAPLVTSSANSTVKEDWLAEVVGAELPPTSPRFLVLSHTLRHAQDGRISYPLVGLYYNPPTSNPTHRMLYASTATVFFAKANVTGRVFQLERPEQLTTPWVDRQLEGSMTRP